MRYFEFRDGQSAKFWSIDLQGKKFTLRFGRIGTAGQTQTKQFRDAGKARTACDNLVAEKIAKGYVETGTSPAPAPAPAATAKARARAKPQAAKKARRPAAAAAPESEHRFHHPEVNPSKFWWIVLAGKQLNVRYGKIGSHGRTLTRTFRDGAAARAEYDKQVARKTAEGYHLFLVLPRPPRAQPAPLPPRPPTTCSTDLDGLLAAIRAEPDDDTTRLVLADWLDEHGEPQRAEFIRLQCRMARLACDWDRPEAVGAHAKPKEMEGVCSEFGVLAARTGALLAEHGARWTDGLPPAVDEVSRTGLQTVFVRGLPAVYARWWVGEPEPRDLLDDLQDAAGRLAFAWVAHVAIDLSDRWSGGYGYEEDWQDGLARHPTFALVNELDLSWSSNVMHDALPDLAAAGPLPALRTLGLHVEQIGEKVEFLHRLTNLSALGELDVSSWEEVGSYDGRSRPAFEWPHFPRLRRLDVAGTCVTDADLTRLADFGPYPLLRRIDVEGASRVTPQGVLALAASPRHPHLTDIVASGYDEGGAWDAPAGAAFVARLTELPQAARLEKLRLPGLGLTDAAVEPLLTTRHLSGVGYLDVRRNPLSPGTVDRLKARFPRVEADASP
jgi:uncharacterized protein (TIGR02996 family)